MTDDAFLSRSPLSPGPLNGMSVGQAMRPPEQQTSLVALGPDEDAPLLLASVCFSPGLGERGGGARLTGAGTERAQARPLIQEGHEAADINLTLVEADRGASVCYVKIPIGSNDPLRIDSVSLNPSHSSIIVA